MDLTGANYIGVKMNLRRKFAADIPGLKALADKFGDAINEPDAITQQSFEGGSHSSLLLLPKGVALKLLEELIAELEPTTNPNAIQPSRTSFADFACRPAQL